MAKPTIFPSWATNLEIDPITGAENKVAPTLEIQQSGLKRGEFLPRAYYNYNADLTAQWLKFLALGNTTYTLSGTDIDLANGGIQVLTLTANTTLTESLNDGETVKIVINAGGFTLTYPASFSFGNAGEPSLLSTNIIECFKVGSTVYAREIWKQT